MGKRLFNATGIYHHQECCLGDGVGAQVKRDAFLTRTMSSNFGTGQGLFGSNQNKTQGAPTPAPSAFANLGANTTSSSAFGGAGAGNTPGGTTSAPSGGIFGGGGAFGSGANTNAPTSAPSGAGTGNSPFGGSLFAGVYTSYSILMQPPHPNFTQQILRQIQGLQGQRPGVGYSQMQLRTLVHRGRLQDKVCLAIPPAQTRREALEVRTNQLEY